MNDVQATAKIDRVSDELSKVYGQFHVNCRLSPSHAGMGEASIRGAVVDERVFADVTGVPAQSTKVRTKEYGYSSFVRFKLEDVPQR